MYLLWSASLGGWLTSTATYHSNPERAARFTPFDAFAIAHQHLTAGTLGMIPVRAEDVEALLND